MVKAVSEGRRREFAAFGWDPNVIPDPESIETFKRSKLRWDEVHEGRHGEMLEWYRKLIHLRRSSSALNDGDLGHIKVLFDEKKRWLVMGRGLVTVMCNLGDEMVELDNPDRFPLLLTSREDVRVEDGKVALPQDSLAVFSGEKM